ncbi:MAG: hypothetical protein ACXV7J_11380 [Methylomonas sp.]
MADYKTHLDRLYRHYSICIRTNDKVALLDLSHSLRIWDDLNTLISPAEHPGIQQPKFKTISIPKKTIRIAKSAYSILAYFPSGVYTWAHQNSIASCDEFIVGQPCILSVRAKAEPNLPLIVHNYLYIRRLLDSDEKKSLNGKDVSFSKTSFQNWMHGEIIRTYKFQDTELMTISREKLIQRMANAFGASHPKDPNVKSREVELILEESFKFKIGNLPLPYFCLLSIAKEILIHMPDILDIPNYPDIPRN